MVEVEEHENQIELHPHTLGTYDRHHESQVGTPSHLTYNTISCVSYNTISYGKRTGGRDPLVIDEPVEFEKSPVEVEGFRKNAHHVRGIYGSHLKLNEENPKDHNL